MENLIKFLRGLEQNGTHYFLGYYTVDGSEPAAVTVHVTVSGDERWEVEFFDSGAVEIERFTSSGDVENGSVDALLAEVRANS